MFLCLPGHFLTLSSWSFSGSWSSFFLSFILHTYLFADSFSVFFMDLLVGMTKNTNRTECSLVLFLHPLSILLQIRSTSHQTLRGHVLLTTHFIHIHFQTLFWCVNWWIILHVLCYTTMSTHMSSEMRAYIYPSKGFHSYKQSFL